MIAAATDIGLWNLPLEVLSSAIKFGTPFLFVSLGECLTEKAGRVNLGLEGTLIFGAMAGYACGYLSDNPWAGVVVAGLAGGLFGALHGVICNRPRVNSVAVGIALMLFGMGLASYFGKPFIKPEAPKLPSIKLGGWSDIEQVQAALSVNVLFFIGLALAPILGWMLTNTRWGLVLRLAGESEEAAAALGYSVNRIRVAATVAGGVLAGIAGSYLSLYSPGVWKEDVSSQQGLMAVALVIFARWKTLNCLWAALLFGGIGTLGTALQSQGLAGGSTTNLWRAAPYVLTLAILIATSSRSRAMVGAPMELTRVR